MNTENKTKHTPGQWWFSKNSLEIGADPIMNTKIAKVYGDTYEEALANGRLMSNAPTMLKFLENELAYLKEICEIYPNHDQAFRIPLFEDMIKKATE
jgi:hypothetical protein